MWYPTSRRPHLLTAFGVGMGMGMDMGMGKMYFMLFIQTFGIEHVTYDIEHIPSTDTLSTATFINVP